MFRKFLKNKKAQNTAEYALLIALVIAGIVAMQQYAQRALQARVRDASIYMAEQTNVIGDSKQYEPYYQSTNYEITRTEGENKDYGDSKTDYSSTDDKTRLGSTSTTYNNAMTEGVGIMPAGI